MKRLLVLMVALFSVTISYSQRDTDIGLDLSKYTTLNNSKGFEIRKSVMEDYYVAFQIERFRKGDYILNVGGAVGIRYPVGRFDLMTGLRAGQMEVQYDITSFSYGLETEVDYRITGWLFVGARFSHDAYKDSTCNRTLARGFFKAGLKF